MRHLATFEIGGEPVGKQRPRMTKQGHVYTPAKTVEYEQAVQWAARAVFKDDPVGNAIAATINVFVVPPKSWPARQRNAALKGTFAPIHRVDLDNVAKAVCDALNGVVYQDDKQIIWLTVRRHWADKPKVKVTIEAFELDAVAA